MFARTILIKFALHFVSSMYVVHVNRTLVIKSLPATTIITFAGEKFNAFPFLTNQIMGRQFLVPSCKPYFEVP